MISEIVLERSECFYIDGQWAAPDADRQHAIVNPATEQRIATVRLGNAADVDRAVRAARRALPAWSTASPAERGAIIVRAMNIYLQRGEELAQTLSAEMGAPITLARQAQVASAYLHMKIAAKLLPDFAFETIHKGYRLRREAVGVCGMITPWNWPANQIMCKLAPALATGCTVVLKPSEMAPLNAMIIADIFHAAGLPAGVLNLINGDGPGVGTAISTHPGIDMVSFTGSTRAGIAVAQTAAASVKRVTQELGGKSANIILEDADLEKAVTYGVLECMNNSGQTCLAPTRMLVPQALHERAVEIAIAAAQSIRVGHPAKEDTVMGPLAHKPQYDKVRSLIDAGIEEGSTLVCGGSDRPENLPQGYYVKPTIFAGVNNSSLVAREEIFGPVLCILPYRDEDEAIAIANDTPYGLAGYVQSGDPERAMAIGRRMETGYILVNGASINFNAPLAGHKQSGNGVEWGEAGFEEYLVTKSVVGV